jgi:hypothetical protein
LRLALLCAALVAACTRPRPVAPAPGWPPLTSESRPWAIWWWPGSAVEEAEIDAHLARYAAAGLGGVHVVPIYGVRGAEARSIPFLSPTWVSRLRFTVKAARARGMGVDLATGTGWPFGGPQVSVEDGSRAARVEQRDGRWQLVDVPTGMKVKRAAPGGEGRVIDHLSGGAVRRYLDGFGRALGGPLGVRAFTNDSFEDMGSDYTPDLLAAFAARRGYDLRAQLPALAGQGDADVVARVVADYRETVSDLLLERFTQPWVAWTHAQGAVAHDQAHGSPGSLLDLYAAADIPQTEAFGPSRLPIPGLRTDPNLPDHFGKPDTLFSKLASSAAHLAGRRLVSAETATWLGEHFQVAPAQVKPEIDRLFLAGVNHVFFHGVTYSPAAAPWPGWLFYASTDFGPESGFWTAMPALTGYVARAQALLQRAAPDNDLLLYFPLYDLWQVPPAGKERRLRHFTAHDVASWLHGHPSGLGRVAGDLLAQGVMFDFVSDRLLARAAGTPVVVPGARFMPVQTWERLRAMAEGGTAVVFLERLPEDVPGLGNLQERRGRLHAAIAALGAGQVVEGVRQWRVGRGRVLLAPDLAAALRAASVRHEPLAAAGVGVLRMRTPDGHLYFLANQSARAFAGWTSLAARAAGAVVMDPLSGRQGVTEVREGSQLFVRLSPGASLMLQTFSDRVPGGPRWPWLLPSHETVALAGPWQLSFLRGGPSLPPATHVDGPTPWSALEPSRWFSGTAAYRTEIDRPAGGPWVLELGGVHATAVVRVNGADAGALWALPFEVDVTPLLRPGRNTVEVEVTSLPANRVAALARAGASRVRYHDIDFVDIRYRPFDPSGWPPLPSGLEGPVRLRRHHGLDDGPAQTQERCFHDMDMSPFYRRGCSEEESWAFVRRVREVARRRWKPERSLDDVDPRPYLGRALKALLDLELDPQGTIAAVGLREPSGVPSFDRRVLEAFAPSTQLVPPPLCRGVSEEPTFRFRLGVCLEVTRPRSGSQVK